MILRLTLGFNPSSSSPSTAPPLSPGPIPRYWLLCLLAGQFRNDRTMHAHISLQYFPPRNQISFKSLLVPIRECSYVLGSHLSSMWSMCRFIRYDQFRRLDHIAECSLN